MARAVHRTIFLVLAAVCFYRPMYVFGAMSSPNYQIQWDNVGVGGADAASSATYLMRDAIGGLAVGSGSSATYQFDSGYRQGIYDQVAAFSVFAQDRSTQLAATALSLAEVSVTDTSGLAIGDYVAIVQNEGAGQVSAVAKVTEIGSGTSFNVDSLTPEEALTIDGANDYVYVMSGSSISLGNLVVGDVATGIFGWEVTADVQQGYSVFVAEDHDFQTPEEVSIADVADGTVTAGTAEYGARSSDASIAGSTFDTEDSAFTTTFTQVSSRDDNSFSQRDFLTIKAAISDSIEPGAYSHTITVVYVGDY